MALSVVAYLLAVTSQRIHDLVETASAFGSAGVFVTALFALFTRFGGAASAYASVAPGMLVWAIGKYAAGLTAPYLLGLVGGPCRLRRCCVAGVRANEQSFRKQAAQKLSLRRVCERCGHLSRSALINSNPLTNYATSSVGERYARGLVRVPIPAADRRVNVNVNETDWHALRWRLKRPSVPRPWAKAGQICQRVPATCRVRV